jgi:hypothetical protein
MGRHKIGLVIPHPEDQKWDSVWKLFRTPNLNLPTLAALIPEDEWDIEIQDEIVGPLDFSRDFDLVFITVTTVVAVRAYEVARLFRERGAKVVLGGIHPSTLPDRRGGRRADSSAAPGRLQKGTIEAAIRHAAHGRAVGCQASSLGPPAERLYVP